MYRTTYRQFCKTGRICWSTAFALYSVMFAALFFSLFLIFRLEGLSPFVGPDRTTYFGRIAYIGEYIRNLPHNFCFYDFRLGLGGDIFNFLWVGALNPIVFLTAPFFCAEQAETAYWIICALHMYFAGIAFMFFCRYKNDDAFASVCGAAAYVFSGYALFYSFRHFHFMTAMIMLPAMFFAAEAALREERLLPLAFVTALSIAVNFYFAAVVTLMTLIYGLARFFEVCPQKRMQDFFRLLFKCAAAYMLGAMLAAPALLPVLSKFAESGRGGVPIVFRCFYHINGILYGLLYFFSSGGTWGTGASLLPITFFAAICFFGRKFSYERWLKIFLLIFSIGIFSPVITRIFSFGTGNYIEKRWSFIFPFIFSYILVLMFRCLTEQEEKDRTSCLAAMLVYSVLILLLHILKLYAIDKYIFVSLILMLITVSALLYTDILQAAGARKVCLASAVFICAFANIYFLYAMPPTKADVPRYAVTVQGIKENIFPPGEVYESYKKCLLLYSIADKEEMPGTSSFFRLDTPELTIYSYILLRQYSVYSYGSLMTKYPKYLIGLENRAALTPWLSRGCDGIASLESLLSVKYFAAENKDAASVPYGFEEKRAEDGYTLFENRYFLPLGYTYEYYMPQAEYEKLSALEKLDAQLQVAALEEEPAGFQRKSTDRFGYVPVSYRISHGDNVVWKGGVLTAAEDKAETVIEFVPVAGSEMYIRLEGFDIIESDSEGGLYALFFVPGVRKIALLSKNSSSTYSGRENYLVRLGSYDDRVVRCKIRWRRKGSYRLGGIKVYAVPMKNYAARINKLREDVLENIHVGNDKISGTISLKKNKILCLSIPYSKGWHARVDGRQAELLKANTFFTALPLEAGDHKVELEYHVPGLRQGLCFFALGAAILSGMIILDKRKKS